MRQWDSGTEENLKVFIKYFPLFKTPFIIRSFKGVSRTSYTFYSSYGEGAKAPPREFPPSSLGVIQEIFR